MNAEADHAYMLVAYLPKYSVSIMANNLKSTSSRRVRTLNTHLHKANKTRVLCSQPYFTCSAGGTTT
ncbi:Transposase IS200 like [Thorsellia anophelis DSM 18579]|uniref:Transposase IS200 like n=1 Tax=Thorsellia anophelis DSM 18579 TaxID=1123402 RepID=A0A1I0A8P7_9GAMM|nr:Transposase IS200 like [Thorsellia anophelis DSM 18579]